MGPPHGTSGPPHGTSGPPHGTSGTPHGTSGTPHGTGGCIGSRHMPIRGHLRAACLFHTTWPGYSGTGPATRRGRSTHPRHGTRTKNGSPGFFAFCGKWGPGTPLVGQKYTKNTPFSGFSTPSSGPKRSAKSPVFGQI